MKRALTALVLVLATVTHAAAVAQPPVDAPSAGTSPTVTHTPTSIVASQPPNPRVKLSYVRFSIGNVDGSAVPLDGLHLDLYPRRGGGSGAGSSSRPGAAS